MANHPAQSGSKIPFLSSRRVRILDPRGKEIWRGSIEVAAVSIGAEFLDEILPELLDSDKPVHIGNGSFIELVKREKGRWREDWSMQQRVLRNVRTKFRVIRAKIKHLSAVFKNRG